MPYTDCRGQWHIFCNCSAVRGSLCQQGGAGVALACAAPARSNGLAASQGKPEWAAVILAALYAAAIGGTAVFLLFGFSSLIAVFVFAFVTALSTMVLARAKIGGHTGDTLGMTQKITELSVLLALASV